MMILIIFQIIVFSCYSPKEQIPLSKDALEGDCIIRSDVNPLNKIMEMPIIVPIPLMNIDPPSVTNVNPVIKH